MELGLVRENWSVVYLKKKKRDATRCLLTICSTNYCYLRCSWSAHQEEIIKENLKVGKF